jgi:1-acyl-sn-glycerol-3-phosphate acyltransferase
VLVLWLGFATTTVVLVANLSRLGGTGFRRRCSHGTAQWWARGILWITGSRCQVEGLEHIGSGSMVVMSNHRSHMDTPLLIAHLPFPFGVIVKKELMRIPVFAGAMRSVGCVAVSRRRSRADHAVLDSVAIEVSRGKNILVFPEGSRAPDDKFLPFKKGGVLIAIKAQVPILPVAVSGTHRVIPLGLAKVFPGPLLLRVGEPIPTSGFGLEDRDELLDRVREAVIGLYQPAWSGESLEESPCAHALQP